MPLGPFPLPNFDLPRPRPPADGRWGTASRLPRPAVLTLVAASAPQRQR
jgi:hypothetical protein